MVVKYLFYIAKKYSIPIFQPFYSYLSKTNNEIVFFISSKVQQDFPNNWPKDKIITELKDAIHYKADFVLIPGNFVDPAIPGIKVQIFHGIGVEKESHYKIRHFFDIYFTSGPFVTKRYKELEKKYNYFQVLESGWPKIDWILNYPMYNLREKYHIPNNKKVILFAPTFSRKMESASALIPHLNDIMQDDEIWLVKFHELMNKETVAQLQIDSPNLRIINEYDITPFLHLADVMISDTSSVIYEFMVLDKPVITLHTQARADKGIDIQTVDELRPALDRCFENPREHQENRQKHLQEINPYLKGKSTESICQQLEKLYKNNTLTKGKKPLNIFRKMQIAYHRKFKKGYMR